MDETRRTEDTNTGGAGQAGRSSLVSVLHPQQHGQSLSASRPLPNRIRAGKPSDNDERPSVLYSTNIAILLRTSALRPLTLAFLCSGTLNLHECLTLAGFAPTSLSRPATGASWRRSNRRGNETCASRTWWKGRRGYVREAPRVSRPCLLDRSAESKKECEDLDETGLTCTCWWSCDWLTFCH